MHIKLVEKTLTKKLHTSRFNGPLQFFAFCIFILPLLLPAQNHTKIIRIQPNKSLFQSRTTNIHSKYSLVSISIRSTFARVLKFENMSENIMNCRPITIMNTQEQYHAHQNPCITAITTNQIKSACANNDFEFSI